MSKIQVQSKNIEQIYQRIKEVLTNARSRAWQAVNTAMVASYWGNRTHYYRRGAKRQGTGKVWLLSVGFPVKTAYC